jgi:Zn-dependent peptidase ImmA (M78 family)/transcriptional regulator with XRE-family HTH domain
MPEVNPSMLVWAREAAGLSLEAAAEKLPAKQLASYESGQKAPSRALLAKMAKLYRRSQLIFYLSQPPIIGSRGEDFRKAVSQPGEQLDPLLDALVRKIKVSQSIVQSILAEEESPKLDYIGSASLNDNPQLLAQRIIDRLGFKHPSFYNAKNVEEAFKYARTCAESIGIFVLLKQDLGSHHSTIDARMFRGFALADPLAPFVVINSQDAKTAWTFTQFHELAHLWLGQTGISGPQEAHVANSIERFCNDVASQALLPNEYLAQHLAQLKDSADLQDSIRHFAKQHHISASMLIYRLYQRKIIPKAEFEELFQQNIPIKLKAPQAEKSSNSGGPGYYVMQRFELGKPLLSLLQNAILDNTISYTTAAKATLGEVKPQNMNNLF